MGVFSILLTLMVQFFASARTLWTANEKRTAVYADASIAMNLMATLLQTTFYTEGGTPFQISGAPASASAARPDSGWDSQLMFVSNTTMKLSDSGTVRYLRFQRGPNAGTDDNVLQLRIFCDTDTDFAQCFQPFGTMPAPLDGTEAGARSCINNFLTTRATDTAHLKPIFRNVTGLKFLPLDRRGQPIYGATASPYWRDASGNIVRTPAGIEIELSLMPDEQTARDWAAMTNGPAKDEFRTKNEYTFRRTVWLGDRTFNQ